MALYTPLGSPPSGWTEEADGLTAAQLDDTLRTIHALTLPAYGVGAVSGSYVDQGIAAANSGTLATAANRFDVFPMVPYGDVTIDIIGVAVSTAVASALVKIVVYDSNALGMPGELLFEGTNLDAGSTGYKSSAFSHTFKAGRVYWLGVRSSSTATLRTVAAGASIPLAVASNAGTNYATVLRGTLTYANAAPDPFVATGFAVTATGVPSVRMRVV